MEQRSRSYVDRPTVGAMVALSVGLLLVCAPAAMASPAPQDDDPTGYSRPIVVDEAPVVHEAPVVDESVEPEEGPGSDDPPKFGGWLEIDDPLTSPPMLGAPPPMLLPPVVEAPPAVEAPPFIELPPVSPVSGPTPTSPTSPSAGTPTSTGSQPQGSAEAGPSEGPTATPSSTPGTALKARHQGAAGERPEAASRTTASGSSTPPAGAAQPATPDGAIPASTRDADGAAAVVGAPRDGDPGVDDEPLSPLVPILGGAAIVAALLLTLAPPLRPPRAHCANRPH